ncbi:MAG: 2-dehydropantoate 2-reductase [Anaerolineaceae bacterium]|nr:2-dehydropantoate 2-reductase [Anaerolineaceae bacterium]
MNYLCFGLGAIGTYLGGSLYRGGNPVVFVERNEIGKTTRQQGLRIAHAGDVQVLRDPVVVSTLEEALAQGPFDVALLAIKSFDTPAFLEGVRPFLKQMPPLICFQNGVENEGLLTGALGQERVIPGTVTSAVERKGVGDVRVERLRGVGVFSGHVLSNSLVDEFNAAGLNAQPFPDAAAMKWSKLLTNLLVNASSAILDLTPEEVLENQFGYRLEIAQLREALAVMDALGIRVVNLPRTPVKSLAFLVRYLPQGIGRPLLQRVAGKGRGGKMPSFHIDLHAGRKNLEVDYLNGAVVRFGRQAGVSTPANRLLNTVLIEMAAGKVDLSEYSADPQKLWEVYLKAL